MNVTKTIIKNFAKKKGFRVFKNATFEHPKTFFGQMFYYFLSHSLKMLLHQAAVLRKFKQGQWVETFVWWSYIGQGVLAM